MSGKGAIKNGKSLLIDWFKNPYNKIFLAIFVFGIFLRFYYFSLTHSQPLWWDEADYLAYAKNLAGLNSDWVVTQQHNSLFPALVSVFFMLGLSESVAKLALEIIPSILLIFLTYTISSKMYPDKRIALVSSFLMSVFWVILFNSMRFHLEIPGLLLGFLSIYVFWQGYEKKDKIFGRINPKWAIPLTAFLVLLTYSLRRGYFLFGFFFLFYVLSTKKWKYLLKDKYNWIAVGFFLALFLIVENLVFTSPIEEVATTYLGLENEINFLPFDVFKSYFLLTGTFLDVLFYLFWGGLIFLILRTGIFIGHIKTTKDPNIKADIFVILSIAITLAYFILIMRIPHIFGEPRWYLPLAFGTFICIARGATFISDSVKKYNKYLALIFLIGLIIIGGFYQLKRADYLIKNKAVSFEGIRQAGLFIKEISDENDVIISQPVPQTIYYSERNVLQPEQITGKTGKQYSIDDFMKGLANNPRAKYLLISFSEPGHPDWMVKTYSNNGVVYGWEIYFLDTRIDFSAQAQDVKQTKTFDNGITFNLIGIKQDVFIYEITRT